MQVAHVQVIPVELKLRLPYRTARQAELNRVDIVFVRLETVREK